MTQTRRALFAILLFAATTLSARVISYAPYTDRSSYPAVQSRLNRHFALVELTPPSQIGIPNPAPTYGQLVVYDFEGAREPRVVFPQDGTSAIFSAAAVREDANGVPVLLIQTFDTQNQQFPLRLSTDGGETWKVVNFPAESIPQFNTLSIDVGGPFAASRYSPVRIGTADTPFVVATGRSVHAIAADGTSRVLFDAGPTATPRVALAGSDRNGTEFLVSTSSELFILRLDGSRTHLSNSFANIFSRIEGWITPEGSVYIDERSQNNDNTILWWYAMGSRQMLFESRTTALIYFAVPTADYNGAWIMERGGSRPSTLWLHNRTGGKQKQWEDITAPEVEALHAGASGSKLLIQVHRPRPAVDARVIIDPALAVWRVGDPAPRVYDELYMNEQPNKGFLHLDVEKIEAGEAFVFDSGSQPVGGGIIISPPPPTSPPTGGGGDVIQEWGVVRASLKQRLVLPSVGRIKGAFGSNWVTDVIIQNPLDAQQKVDISYTSAGGTSASSTTRMVLTLQPLEIRLIEDVLASLFSMDVGVGALFLDPEAGITATSRTYSRSPAGTYGFGMIAVDLLAGAASPRFPVSFAGAFPGMGFRTNMTLTDTSGHGTEASILAAGNQGFMGFSDATVSTQALGHEQINGVTDRLGLLPFETGALLVRPDRGFAVASVFTVDNKTNDSTYFPPDLPSAAFARTIPAIGRLDGANNSRFRSDLYMFNPSAQPRSILLQVTPWDQPQGPANLSLTLLPYEARVIKDVLGLFGRTGIARLRYQSATNDGSGVRVTSRTYTIDANGGTYGFLMPPLNNFQIGGNGDTLEILGAIADERYRTNIGLVELNAWPTGQNATARIEILDRQSREVDAFTVNVPSAGGMQINDVFRARGINVSGPVLIRISPANGTIGAYATNTDNATNDSIYLAANLAAKE